jgi:CheY-like chemotaxis protein
MPHILLVDDDAAIRRVVRRQLEGLGCRVTEAADGDAALACQHADPADILLTDMVMPGKEGLETIQDFRRRYPGMRLVAMSGGGVGDAGNYLKVAQAFGAVSLLPKPFTLEELANAVGVLRPTV